MRFLFVYKDEKDLIRKMKMKLEELEAPCNEGELWIPSEDSYLLKRWINAPELAAHVLGRTISSCHLRYQDLKLVNVLDAEKLVKTTFVEFNNAIKRQEVTRKRLKLWGAHMEESTAVTEQALIKHEKAKSALQTLTKGNTNV